MTHTPSATRLWQLPGKALHALRQRGPAGLGQDIRQYLRWMRSG